ncbi:hypothetical protein [Oerskovia enterophila]|uniref:Uncharacterized protein n=1 Tax=Oerskovia enterophila TaxID=43678 RepID=A0A163QUZ5_9CELL|nr:hypothetical protein [Oerskovia enterophila]KZM34562.1 hypothetical protein OJAG_28610 [Oerskovia enterophila]
MARSWTIRELAREAGVSRKSVWAWVAEQGWERPTSGPWILDAEQARLVLERFEQTAPLRTPREPVACGVDDCERTRAGTQDVCKMHYQRRARTGSTDRSSGGDWQTAKTHCPAGHEYTPENTYRFPSDAGTRRRCRTCRIAQSSRPRT